MVKEFIADFTLENNQQQNVEFRLNDNNNINANFDITQQNMNATFEIQKNGDGDKYFVFEQASSSREWIINHNLNKKASVTVVDEYERVVTPAVEYVNDNKIILRFNFAFKGKAYLN